MGSFDVVHSSKGGGSYKESCILTFQKPPDQKNYEVSSSSAVQKLSRNRKWRILRLIDMIFLPLG